MISLLLTLSLLLTEVKGIDKDISGTYVRRVQRNSNIRQFGRTITLNCDSTVIATFQGDMMNEKVTGSWTTKGDTIKVTINEPVGHWHKENYFLFRKRKLLHLVTEINGERIIDKRIQEALFKESKKYAYDRTKKQDCQ
jgi:hypothetical protein